MIGTGLRSSPDGAHAPRAKRGAKRTEFAPAVEGNEISSRPRFTPARGTGSMWGWCDTRAA